jgi:uncharacterized damage-inducible protein DinB
MASSVPLLVRLIQPASGTGWHGGPTPLGSLRGVGPDQAWWSPTSARKSIWALVLHITYWKYAVRRRLEGGPRGGFARAPSNWPAPPPTADDERWRSDVALLRDEHLRLLRAASAVPSASLGRRPQGSRRWTYADLITGIALHDAYHTGQIQLMKRLWRERRALGR